MPPNELPEENKPVEPTEKTSSLKQIRTYQGDVASALGRQDESIFSIQQKERAKQGLNTQTNPSSNNSNRKQFLLLFFGTLVLVALSVVGGWLAYKEFIKKTTAPVAEIPLNRFISPNTEMDLNIASSSRAVILEKLKSVKSTIQEKELRHIILREGEGKDAPIATTQEFFNTLNVKASGSLLRAFDPLFMFGMLGQSTFMIIKLDSFENAFAGMLLWEENLKTDLGLLFEKPVLINEAPETTSTSTVATTTPVEIFKDKTINNKDIRLLETSDGQLILYSFFNNNILIITDSIETLNSIIDKLNREQLSR